MNITNPPTDSVAPLNNQMPLNGLEHIAAMSTEAIYMIDFQKEGFNFVANHPFFLYGHSVEEVLSLGYDFYPKIIHDKDLSLFMNMLEVIQERISGMNDPDINYFSFTIRVKHHVKHMMAYHKLMPVFVDGNLKFGICMLSNSVLKTPGHLYAHYHNGNDYEEYSQKSGRWHKKTKQPLSKREKELLRLAYRGKTGRKASDKMCVSYSTLRNIQASLFKKLDVHSMMHAVLHAFNHLLVFEPPNQPKQEESTVIQKQRRPMTPEKLLRIQEELNRGHSVNSIAKQVGVSEFTIRYSIKTGKLNRKDS